MMKTKTAHADPIFLFLLAFLILFGIVIIYDATTVFSQDAFGGAYRFTILQALWVLTGLVGFWYFYNTDYHKLRKIALPMFLTAFLFLLMLAVAGLVSCDKDSDIIFAPCINGARRWVYFNPPPLPKIPIVGVLGFQPSEFVKLALIIYLAVLIEKNSKSRYRSFFVYLVVTSLTSFLVLLQPNMSTSILIFVIGTVMYFASNLSLLPLFITFPIVSVFGSLFIFISDYRKARLFTFLSPHDANELSLGYHIKQILIALGSGGLFGLGFGQSRQKFQYLPEITADSIFAIVGEELGFIGTTLLVFTFTYLFYRGFLIAKKAPDLLGRLLAVGVTSWLACQFFLNVAAMVRIIPLTGIPLPLISYGGSSTVFSMAALGILANVSRYSID